MSILSSYFLFGPSKQRTAKRLQNNTQFDVARGDGGDVTAWQVARPAGETAPKLGQASRVKPSRWHIPCDVHDGRPAAGIVRCGAIFANRRLQNQSVKPCEW
jgi:hypothetical protein